MTASPLDAAKYLAKEADIPVNGAQPLFTEYGNAQRLVEWHKDDLHYNYDWKGWIVYMDGVWSSKHQGAVMRHAKATVKQMYRDASTLAANAAKEEDDLKRVEMATASDALLKWAKQSESRKTLEATIALAESEPGIPIESKHLDTHHMLFNCKNGTIDLTTGELREHSRKDLLTKIAEVSYDADAKCPQWLTFLDRIMGGDAGLIGYLQRAMGYSLTGVDTEHCLFVLHGTGRNGKSTFLGTFMDLMGDYARKGPSDLLLSKKNESHPTERSILHGTRFVPCIETEEGRRMDENMVKELTGGDVVSTRRMREDFWDFKPTHHLWLGTNHKPNVRGTDIAIWSRLRLVPFIVTIPLSERDKDLAEKLKLEWPGILNWAIEGCLEWQRNGLQEPPGVIRATDSYQKEQDILGTFLTDSVVADPEAKVKASDLYEAYTTWAKASGERTIAKRAFGLALEERAYTQARGAGGTRLWRGLKLIGQTEMPAEQSSFDSDTSDASDTGSPLTPLRDEAQRGYPGSNVTSVPTSLSDASDASDASDIDEDTQQDPWETVDDDIGI